MIYGLLTINWKTRSFQLDGLTGSAADEMADDAVLKRLAEAEGKRDRDVETYAVAVFDPEESDGAVQVALYSADEVRSEMQKGV